MLNEMTKETLSMNDAIKLIRKKRTVKGYQCYIGASVNLPIKDKEDRVFPAYSCVPVSFKVAEKVITDLMKGFDHRGAMINISYSDQSIFIG